MQINDKLLAPLFRVHPSKIYYYQRQHAFHFFNVISSDFLINSNLFTMVKHKPGNILRISKPSVDSEHQKVKNGINLDENSVKIPERLLAPSHENVSNGPLL